MRRLLLPLLLIALLPTVPAARAQTTREQAARLAVDVLLLKGNRELRGSIVSRDAEGATTVAVQRSWLNDHQPQLAAEQATDEARRRQTLYVDLVARLDAWINEVPGEKLAERLRDERARFQRYADDPAAIPNEPPSQFVLIDVAADRIRRTLPQTDARRKTALAAWKARLDGVETRSASQLEQELDDDVKGWRSEIVDLSDRLPQTLLQEDREWGARRTIYEYQFGTRLELQGTGAMLIAAPASGEQADVAGLVSGLLQGGLTSDLADLLGGGLNPPPTEESSWVDRAARLADERRVNGCRVTRVDQDLAARRAMVTDGFLAKLPGGDWAVIWEHQETADLAADRKNVEKSIRADPQVAAALKAVESLGLTKEVDLAIQFGAATMEAQNNAEGRFLDFCDRYTQRLDGPPLRWNSRAQKD